MTGKKQLQIIQGKSKKSPFAYQERTYRFGIAHDSLVASSVQYRETDLHILAPHDVSEQALSLIVHYRRQLEQYIAKNGSFLASLSPLDQDLLAPPLAKSMLQAGQLAGVGPMAAVA